MGDCVESLAEVRSKCNTNMSVHKWLDVAVQRDEHSSSTYICAVELTLLH